MIDDDDNFLAHPVYAGACSCCHALLSTQLLLLLLLLLLCSKELSRMQVRMMRMSHHIVDRSFASQAHRAPVDAASAPLVFTHSLAHARRPLAGEGCCYTSSCICLPASASLVCALLNRCDEAAPCGDRVTLYVLYSGETRNLR